MSPDRRLLTVSAPGRAGIIGNPTDMYGGAVLSCTVGMRARVVLTPDDGLILETAGREVRIANQDDLRPQHDLFDLPRAVVEHLHLPRPNCRVRWESEIPLGSGMAGSTALVVALLQGFLTWQRIRIGSYPLAERARHIERHHLQVVCGYQDAYMCVFGGLNYMDFRGRQFRQGIEDGLFATVEPLAEWVPWLPLVLCHSGVQRSSGAVHQPLWERWLAGDAAVTQGYQRIAELAQMGKMALLTADWPMLGRLMNENHAIQRDLGGSGEVNEQLIRAALNAGALGAKLAGAGQGGTIISLWPWSDTTALEQSLLGAGARAVHFPVVAPGVTVQQSSAGNLNA